MFCFVQCLYETSSTSNANQMCSMKSKWEKISFFDTDDIDRIYFESEMCTSIAKSLLTTWTLNV